MTEIKFKLKTPMTPNFVHVEGANTTIPIADLTEEQLIAIAEEWKKDLLAKAKKLKERLYE